MAKGNFGERLKRERDLREVSADELTKATRISNRFLDALENEDWEKLPGGVFGRGFVRTIARYLGLNEESLLAEYDLARGEKGLEASRPYESAIPRPPAWVPILTVLAALLVLAGVVTGAIYGWRRFAAHRAAKKSSAVSLGGQPQTAPAAPFYPATALFQVTIADSSVVLLELNGSSMPTFVLPAPPVQ